MGYPITEYEKDLWEYIRKLENEIIGLRARIKNLEKDVSLLRPYREDVDPFRKDW